MKSDCRQQLFNEEQERKRREQEQRLQDERRQQQQQSSSNGVRPEDVLMQALTSFDRTTSPQSVSSNRKLSAIQEEDVISQHSLRAAASLGSRGGSKTGGRNIDTPVWMHPNITKAKAESILSDTPDGTFLIRRRINPDEYVLSLVYLGNATHHLIAPNDQGVLAINKKTYGDDLTAITGLVDALRLPRSDWPQPLQEFKPNPDASQDDIDAENRFVAMLTRAYTSQ